MIVYVNMPQMGESVAEGTILRWRKKPGDSIARDEAIVDITTDKVDTEVPSQVAGTLGRILAEEGMTLAVGAPLAEIETEDAVPPVQAASVKKDDSGHFKASGHELVNFSRSAGTATTVPIAPASAPQARGSSEPRTYSPVVMRAALEIGLSLRELDAIAGTCFHGRVTVDDVQRAARSRPKPGLAGAPAEAPSWLRPHVEETDTIVEMTGVRKKIAEHMIWSQRLAAHATAFVDVDLSRVVLMKEKSGASYLTFFAESVVQLLQIYPIFNACALDDGKILYKGRIHLGIAVAVDEDLFVPVIRLADELSFDGLARAIRELTQKARGRKLVPDDMGGGTFTITNPGTFGGVSGTPIINQPQVAILGLGAITKKPVVIDDAICIRSIMTLSLSFDHRVIDGALGFKFLEELRRRLEDFPEL